MAGSPDDSTISDGFATQGNATSHAASSSSHVVASTAQDIKRRPGRPKGSKNKRKELFDPSIPKPRRGRPPGTGPKQKAAAAAALASTSDSDSDESAALAKRPVGRPSKIPPARPLQIRFREAHSCSWYIAAATPAPFIAGRRRYPKQQSRANF
ncbi:hypothetical protein C8J57DRAFT_1241646 [Mycena rebaudengoi]|nr:hypothetical protein C8J57DRAFT_1241646 [Mycena rebaudengoi]